jgi:hypothetical protein
LCVVSFQPEFCMHLSSVPLPLTFILLICILYFKKVFPNVVKSLWCALVHLKCAGVGWKKVEGIYC